MKLQKDLREFIGLLNVHSVDFVVVGGHAVAFHSYPRFTGDIDFLVRPSATNASRLVAVLKSFGFPDADVLQDGFSKPGIVLQLGAPPNQLTRSRRLGRANDLADVKELDNTPSA